MPSRRDHIAPLNMTQAEDNQQHRRPDDAGGEKAGYF
jgi:hypothetical protein